MIIFMVGTMHKGKIARCKHSLEYTTPRDFLAISGCGLAGTAMCAKRLSAVCKIGAAESSSATSI